MGRWIVSTLCASVAAGGFAAAAVVQAHPLALRPILDDLAARQERAYARITRLVSAPAPEPAPFITTAIQRGPLEQIVTATGALQPVDTVEVGSQLAGQIADLFVDFNDRVHKGDPLARIDQRSFISRVEQARASLEMAAASVRVQQARLERARIDLDNAKGNRAVLAARLENAQVMLEAAKRNVDRKTMLRSREATSVATLEEAQTDLASRKAQLRETVSLLELNAFAVDAAAADLRRLEAELIQAKAAVPLQEASLRAAQIELDRTTIRSPIDGVIVGRFVSAGQTLAAGLEARTAFNVARNLGEMEIHARVDETDIGRVAPRQRASFTVDAYPGRRFEASVRQVRKAPQSNQGVVTYTVVLTTDNREGLLLPGMTALARLTVHREDDVLKLPLAALRFRPARAVPEGRTEPGTREQAVWVQDPAGALRPVAVTTGASSADQVVLRGGALQEGDRVVVGQADASEPARFLGIRLGL
ncbi:efflux RND transporter periplasmic adaptor subunit [Methylobacterium sp. 17Sr1-1]|uniref:efflux RND transporter periplasmic adaptor subunit n=1 Tax=Methylobacterium sp. 17Sr1-1 TaxID=2202826 RepID=UPI001FDF604B|nr:efflux RND transporter periplasmic adaptor subunit [Methylobacterium sp. 17Sr1-1]